MLRFRPHEPVTSTMNTNNGLPLVAPRVTPGPRPGVPPRGARDAGVSARWSTRRRARVPVGIALEQADGSVFRFETRVLPESHPQASANGPHVERLVKFLLWSRGGWRIHINGPAALAARLTAHYRDTATGRFDANFVGERIFDRGLEVVHTARSAARALVDQAARPPSRGMPHRLRSGRQRPQGGGGRRWPSRVQ